MSFFKPHAACFDDNGIHLTIDHFLKKRVLISKPEISHTEESESLAYVLNSKPLVVRKDGAARHGLHFWMSLLDLDQKLI